MTGPVRHLGDVPAEDAPALTGHLRVTLLDDDGAGVIPTALIADRSGPLAAGDRGQAVGRRRQPVPGLAAGRDDRLVVRPDAMAGLVLAQVLPHVLDRVQLGAVARQ